MNALDDTQVAQAYPNVPATDTTHEPQFRLWASDNQVYGPVALSVLAEWASDSRVFEDSWLYDESRRTWELAGQISDLKPYLNKADATDPDHRGASHHVSPDELRQFPAIAALSGRDLAQLIQLSELVIAASGQILIRRNEPGDSIYFVLTGSVYARIVVGQQEQILATIPAGQFFGEISMFTTTPRVADVIAKEPSRLVRFSTEAFRTLIVENPAAAAPMLYNITTVMAHRIMATNNKFQSEVASGFVWR